MLRKSSLNTPPSRRKVLSFSSAASDSSSEPGTVGISAFCSGGSS